MNHRAAIQAKRDEKAKALADAQALLVQARTFRDDAIKAADSIGTMVGGLVAEVTYMDVMLQTLDTMGAPVS